MKCKPFCDGRVVVLRKGLWFDPSSISEKEAQEKERNGWNNSSADKHAGRWKADGWSSTRGTNDRFYEMNDSTCCRKHQPCKLTSVIKEPRRKQIRFSVKISTAPFICEEMLVFECYNYITHHARFS